MAANNPNPWAEIRKNYNKLWKSLPQAVSVIAQTEFKENFRRQGYRTDSGSVEKWQARQHGRGKNDSKRALLIKTGRLRRSLKTAHSSNMAKVLSNVPYAQIHNEGGKLKGKKRVLSSSVKSGKTRWRKGSAQATMPKRTFMITTKPLMNDIEKYLFDQIDKIFK